MYLSNCLGSEMAAKAGETTAEATVSAQPEIVYFRDGNPSTDEMAKSSQYAHITAMTAQRMKDLKTVQVTDSVKRSYGANQEHLPAPVLTANGFRDGIGFTYKPTFTHLTIAIRPNPAAALHVRIKIFVNGPRCGLHFYQATVDTAVNDGMGKMDGAHSRDNNWVAETNGLKRPPGYTEVQETIAINQSLNAYNLRVQAVSLPGAWRNRFTVNVPAIMAQRAAKLLTSGPSHLADNNLGDLQHQRDALDEDELEPYLPP